MEYRPTETDTRPPPNDGCSIWERIGVTPVGPGRPGNRGELPDEQIT